MVRWIMTKIAKHLRWYASTLEGKGQGKVLFKLNAEKRFVLKVIAEALEGKR